MNKKKILITGGAGYVGSRLIKFCLNAGYEVHCYDIMLYGDSSIKQYLKNKNFQLIKKNLTDYRSLENAITNIDFIIHLAAIVGDQPCLVAPESAFKINYLATKKLIEIASKKRVKKLIFSSTCSNYGIADDGKFADEDSKLNPVSLYAETKIDCEKFISNINTKELDCITLRFATAYGVSERTRFDLTINSFAYEAIKKKKLFIFAANTWRPYIHVNDMCNFILKFLKSEELTNIPNKKKIFNVGFNSQNYTKKNILDLIVNHIPNTEIKYVDDIIDQRNYKVSFNKLNQVFNCSPIIGIHDGILELIDFIKNNNKIDNIFNNSNLEALKIFFKKNEARLLI